MEKRRLDYKWVIIVASFMMVFTTLGFCSSTKRLFLGPVTGALDIARSIYSINDSFRYITAAIINMCFGSLVAKLGPRKMIGLGFLSQIGSMLICSFATNVGMFYIGGALLGLGFAMTTTTMVGYVVNIWYKEKRGTIMGAILCANGIGGAVATQILNPIIVQDYRVAYRAIAIILLVVGTVVVAVFRDAPKGETLPRQASGKKKPKGDTWTGITLKEALKKPYFYMVAASVFLTGLCLQGALGIDNQQMVDRGIDKNFAAGVISIASLALTVCKFLVGACNDRKGLKFTMLICDIAAISMMLMLAFVSDSMLGRGLAVGYSFVNAIALPLETIMLPLIAADMFGEKEYGKMLGVFAAINSVGFACGPFLTNLAYDFAGSYTPVLLLYAGIMTAITVSFLISQKQAGKVKKEVALREAAMNA